MPTKQSLIHALAVVILAGTTFAAASASAKPHKRVYVRVGPPRPVVERVVVAPRRDYVYVPGYYEWTGRRYVWVESRYVRPPRPRAVYVPARWEREPRRGWYFVAGYWR